jgi:hypothetical protein
MRRNCLQVKNTANAANAAQLAKLAWAIFLRARAFFS